MARREYDGINAGTTPLLSLIPWIAGFALFVSWILLLVAVAPIHAYEQSSRAIREELDRSGASPFGSRNTRKADHRPMLIALAVVSPIVGLIAFVLFAPEIAEGALLGLRTLAAGRLLPSAAELGPREQDYRYPQSPFQTYVETERRFLPYDDAVVTTFADDVAREVGWNLISHTGEGNIDEAERALWATGEEKSLPLWIAAALQRRGVFYHRESLLSRSFDPSLHRGEGEVHMDCDQLAHLFTHVGWRLGLDILEISSPLHVYITYQPPAKSDGSPGEGQALWVETTNFRKIDEEGGRVDFLGEGIGEDFFIEESYHPSGKSGIYATSTFAEAAGLFKPEPWEDVEDGIIANVVVGLEEAEVKGDYRSLLASRLPASRNYVLISNLHKMIMDSGEAAMEAGDSKTAMAEAEAATALRESHGELLIRTERTEALLLARALLASGDKAQGRALLQSVIADYPSAQETGVARTRVHADALLLEAEQSAPIDEAELLSLVLPVFQMEAQLALDQRIWGERLCEIMKRSAENIREVVEPVCG